ncbi:unnamed protein product [Phytophthora lilii]|uniref:Unnamed protein product n=1 Tax=Phytophthora lilii TaxID=2077276 RepID=A0A9W7CYY2_9STRA|nr:unnamed protein product [Phytophthora lilii]
MVVVADAAPVDGHDVDESAPAFGGFDRRRFANPSFATDAVAEITPAWNEVEIAVLFEYPSSVDAAVALYLVD